MIRHNLELFADYYQFYIQDETADGNLSDAWNDDAVDRLLAVAPGVVGVGTVRNMDVTVTIDILDRSPTVESELFDHIVECSISIESGRIVAAGCTDYFPEAARIDVGPGVYRVRVSYAGLNSLSAGQLEGDDRYHLQLWPAPASEIVILKRRS
jgi:hypothetical protein